MTKKDLKNDRLQDRYPEPPLGEGSLEILLLQGYYGIQDNKKIYAFSSSSKVYATILHFSAFGSE